MQITLFMTLITCMCPIFIIKASMLTNIDEINIFTFTFNRGIGMAAIPKNMPQCKIHITSFAPPFKFFVQKCKFICKN